MTELLVLTIGHVFSAILCTGLGFFVYFSNPKRAQNILFFALALAVAFFDAYFAIAINLPPSPLAYDIWFLNIFDVLVTVFNVHFLLVAIERDHAFRWYIRFTYAISALTLIAAFIFPHEFLPYVSQKLYLKSYLNAGPIYDVMLFCFLFLPGISYLELLRAYFRGGIDKIRAQYYIWMDIVGYGLGCISFPLVYGIRLDPFLGMLVGLYMIPIAYGVIAKQLLDIRVVVKRALFYALGIGLASGGLIAILLLNNYFVDHVPGFRFWFIPAVAGIAAFIVGRTVWKQARDADLLKYEFITIATHKLRTPLTRIRWQTAELLSATQDAELKKKLATINDANNLLIELTNVLLEASNTGNAAFSYTAKPVDMTKVVTDAVNRLRPLAEERGIALTTDIATSVPQVKADPERLTSAVEVIVENAISYTPKDGEIHIELLAKKKDVIFRVADTGIGISSDDQKHLFTQFFRTAAAKVKDTEGVGLGLMTAKSIVESYRGDIGVHSDGEGKGSTFWFSLPT